MDPLAPLKAVLVFGPIVGLFALGLVLALRSGVANVRDGGPRLMLANLRQTLLVLAWSLLGLMVVQQIVGFRLGVLALVGEHLGGIW
jgi:hypothetical protein